MRAAARHPWPHGYSVGLEASSPYFAAHHRVNATRWMPHALASLTSEGAIAERSPDRGSRSGNQDQLPFAGGPFDAQGSDTIGRLTRAIIRRQPNDLEKTIDDTLAPDIAGSELSDALADLEFVRH